MGEAIAITSGKGGVGKSSVCINMGMVLAQKGYRVCLIDVDLGLKNLDVMLGLENRVIYDLKDVMEGRCTLANAMIRDKRQDNLYLLPACKTIHIQYFHGEDLKIVVEELKNQFDYILLDTPAGIESGFIHSIACVSRAIVVTTLDVTALQDADRIIGLLESGGLRDIRLIINRLRPEMIARGDMMSVEDVLEILAVDLIGAILDDEQIVISTNQGEPLSGKNSQAEEEYRNICRRLMGEEVPYVTVRRKNGVFHRLGSIFRK